MSQLQSACIVDDDPIHLFGMKILMKRLDFSDEVLVFQNGQEAIDGLLDRLGAGKPLPLVIFLDLNMPIKDGWGFLDDFVKIPHHNRERVTIYVVSSSIHPLDQERAKKYEVVGNYIIKPVNEQELKQILVGKD
ncbi:response regulator [Flagellimonas alvinocaridis]|uniref:Response regulator n=1 Tax=Flagellimonas alvinocaridis TaxID=2530200 RepID=A0A4S8RSE4_9FLAO|nr:response regulator [Allomuricauda alvinocaridis]THV58059.1 response regulator [Allomuricauda alvinocaridis]